MLRFEDIEVGELVTVADYRGVWSGKVIAKKKREGSFDRKVTVVVELNDGFTLVEDLSKLFRDQREAWLNKGRDLQNEASQKLTEAAAAFQRAGVPDDEVEAR